jgi:zinc protease
VHVLFPGGRTGETPDIAGITNLLLKSSMKGSRSYTAAELAERIENLGTSIGLTMAADYLGFSIKLLSPRARDGLSLLREVISAPTFPPEEVEKEKESIYAEIRRQRDSMFSRSLDLFNRARFGTHPYGLPASGEETAIAGLTDEVVKDWHQQWVRSEGAIIAVVGSISSDEAVELFTGAIPVGESSSPRVDASIPDAPASLSESVDRQQTASVLGFDGVPISSDDRHALDLIAEVTSGLAGRFFQAVRGDNALAYAVTSFHRPRRESGIFGTYTATSPDKEKLAREIILEECARLAREPVSEEELRDAKAAIRGEHAIHTQTFSAQAAELAVNHLYGLPLHEPERYLDRIDSITAEEIMSAAARYLRPDRYWLGVVRGTPVR